MLAKPLVYLSAFYVQIRWTQVRCSPWHDRNVYSCFLAMKEIPNCKQAELQQQICSMEATGAGGFETGSLSTLLRPSISAESEDKWEEKLLVRAMFYSYQSWVKHLDFFSCSSWVHAPSWIVHSFLGPSAQLWVFVFAEPVIAVGEEWTSIGGLSAIEMALILLN